MNKLIAQLQRLYFLPGQQWPSPAGEWPAAPAAPGGAALDLVAGDGSVRALLVNVARGGDWAQVAALYEGVQRELELPPPAIAVSPEFGYQLWFSLAEPTPLPLVSGFVDRLRQRYLAAIPPAQVELLPRGGANTVPLVPARQPGGDGERWSAYIDPSMGSMFVDESWCEMAPNLDKQAEMLAGLKSIAPQQLHDALATLAALADDERAAAQAQAAARSEAAAPPERLHVGSDFADPQRFLLAVMNDASASAEQRIRAACALLPYFAAPAAK